MNEKIKILILEDNSSDAALMKRELNLSKLDLSTEVVDTRSTFENALNEYKPHVILSDYSLPSFDGITAFHITQEKSPDIPFIIVSGTIGEESAIELIKSGISDYVLKDKLFTLIPKMTRALKDSENIKAKKNADKKIKIQNEKLFEIAFLQSHQVRVPVAQILGLYSLFKFDNPADPSNNEIFSMLKTAVESLDKTIHEITEKTEEIKNMD